MDNQFQDIMPLEEIVIDYSSYFVYVGVSIFIVVLLYLSKKYLFKKKEIVLSTKEISIRDLKSLDFEGDDAKELLYRFTLLAKECVEDIEKLDLLLKQIEPLKYKKENLVLDDKIKSLLKGYINEL